MAAFARARAAALLQLLLLPCVQAAAWQRQRCGPGDQVTPWGAAVDPTSLLTEYPRPLLVRGPTSGSDPRASFAVLNGVWQWEAAAPSSESGPPPWGRTLNQSILVPFAPETCLSGIGYLAGLDFRSMWYRLVFDNPLAGRGPAFRINFEAVDYNASVFLNGVFLGWHAGGYDAFGIDVPLANSSNELLLFVHDPTEEGPQPQGKQLIQARARCGVTGNKYIPTSGIWGTVWLEAFPRAHVTSLRVRSNTSAALLWVVAAGFGSDATVHVAVSLRGAAVASYTSPLAGADPMTLHVPPPHDVWRPGAPALYDFSVTVSSASTAAADTVSSYFALRSVSMERYSRPAAAAVGPLAQTALGGSGADMPGTPFALPSPDPSLCAAACDARGNCSAWQYTSPACAGGGAGAAMCALRAGADAAPLQPDASQCHWAGRAAVPPGPGVRPALNGAPIFLLGALDQGYWPDGGLTAPADAALASDLKGLLALGFNAVRMHTKVSSRRWYHWADRLGVLVLQDAVQKFEREGRPATPAATAPLFQADLTALIDGRGSHPCIVGWVLLNEGDCVGDVDVPALAAWADETDGAGSAHGAVGMGRLIDVNSGGPADALGLGDAHDVHSYPYPSAPRPTERQFAMVGETGGLGWYDAGHEWQPGGCYTARPGGNASSPAAFAQSLVDVLGALALARPLLSAAVLTQWSDVECECDGIVNYDRSRKLDAAGAAAVAAAASALITGGGDI